MLTRLRWFNIYFSLIGSLCLFSGCETTGDKQPAGKNKDKEATLLRFHLEVNSDGTGLNSPVSVFRAQPVMVNVNKNSFLNEGDIMEAMVVDVVGGFAISIQFDPHGMLVLDSVTGGSRGSRIAIMSQFGSQKDGAVRWIAAPRITHHIKDGRFTFTPDASLEESERIVRGINNIAIELKKQPKKPKTQKK